MTTKRISNFLFPPPSFLLMPAAGIDISDRSIRYTELVPTISGHRLGRFGSVTLPEGVVENGRIMSPEHLKEALTSLRIQYSISFVRASIPEEQIYFFRTVIPKGSKETLRSTIELSLEEHVPISTAEATFDFEVVGTSGADVEVAVTTAPKEMIESYADVFEKAGLTLLSLEIEAEALARTVIHDEDTFAHLIVDFGELRTSIAIVYCGQVYFTSTVNIGGQMLTETLAKHFGKTMAEAEVMKREFGLHRTVADQQDLFSLLLNNIAVLRDEINKHFLYWHTHNDESGKPRPPIEQIILVGENSNLPGLSDYLSASLRVKTIIGNVWTNIELPTHGVPELLRDDSLSYATAIGLSLFDAEITPK